MLCATEIIVPACVCVRWRRLNSCASVAVFNPTLHWLLLVRCVKGYVDRLEDEISGVQYASAKAHLILHCDVVMCTTVHSPFPFSAPLLLLSASEQSWWPPLVAFHVLWASFPSSLLLFFRSKGASRRVLCWCSCYYNKRLITILGLQCLCHVLNFYCPANLHELERSFKVQFLVCCLSCKFGDWPSGNWQIAGTLNLWEIVGAQRANGNGKASDDPNSEKKKVASHCIACLWPHAGSSRNKRLFFVVFFFLLCFWGFDELTGVLELCSLVKQSIAFVGIVIFKSALLVAVKFLAL